MSRAIRAMYTRIDRGYELVNHLFSLGLDVSWRRRAARRAADTGGDRWLDLCTGTGEMALALARLAAPGALVVGTDFSLPMMRVAQAKGAEGAGVALILADAATLPFADESFDVVTISFASRNLEGAGPLTRFFGEVRRVLAPGGRFVHLETSQPPGRLVNALFRGYVGAAITPLGVLVTGAAGPYRFLTRSVQRFHGRDELAELLRDVGFEEVECRPMMLGAVAIHEATKGARAAPEPVEAR